MAEKDTMITTGAMLPHFTKSSVRVCSLQLPITELSHFRYLVAVDIVVGDRSNRSETLSLRLEAMVIVIKERKRDRRAISSADAFVSKLPDAWSFETGVYGALISIFHLTDFLGRRIFFPKY